MRRPMFASSLGLPVQNNITLTRKISIAFSTWALILVFAGATPRVTDFAQSIAWTEYWISSGITVLLAASLMVVVVWRQRQQGLILWPAIAVTAVSLIQIVLGALTLWTTRHLAAAYLLVAMLNLGIALFLTTITYLPLEQAKIGGSSKSHRFYFRSIVVTGLGI